MCRSRTVLRIDRALLTSLLLTVLTAGSLIAQAAPSPAMGFASETLTWYLAGDGDRVWERAGPTMRELAGSPAGMRKAAAEIAEDLGAEAGLLSEQLFDHPEGGGWQVYVRGVRHAQVPEMFWIVIFSPARSEVQMIMPQPRQTIRALFPQVTLP